MLSTPLPSEIDIRKLVVKGAEISALVPISSLPRIAGLLAGEDGDIEVRLHFYKDEARFRRVDGQLSGSVEVFCQRCLEPMVVNVDVSFALGVVWSEDDAQRLPKSLEPLIVGEELIDLADVVSDELILSLPHVNYHDEADCKQPVGYSSVDPAAVEIDSTAKEEKENPFKVLENLKLDK